MIDCHSHLADPAFENDIDMVIKDAKQSGVRCAVVLPEGYSQFDRVIELSQRYPDFVFPGLGIHPVQASQPNVYDRSAILSDWTPAVQAYIESRQDQIVCLGECGLDFTPYYIKNATDKDDQRVIFKKQVELALLYDLPVNVHSRSAGNHTISLLAECGAKKVLLHAFDAKVSTAMRGVELGYFFSVPPSVIRSSQKQKLVEHVPLENLLLETDSPALGPDKQGRNVPANITVSCEFIAQVKKVDVEMVQRITTENAMRLFTRLSQMFK